MSAKATRLLSKTVFGVFQQKSLLSILRRELVLNFGYDNKLAIAEVLAQKILDLFEEYAPDREKLKPLQILWLSVDASDPPGYGKTLADTRQRTVILDLWTQEEIEELSDGARPRTLLPLRVARLCQQAYKQGGLLNLTDLSLILGISASTVCHAIQTWEHKHPQNILPMRSTIHDLGSNISHKRQIVALHLQGYFPSEIARVTDHEPNNVDRYLGDFERVYDMAKDAASPNRISFITGLREKLVTEYLKIVEEHGLLLAQPQGPVPGKGGERREPA